MSARLRLLKVIVQPVFVIDDGDILVEQTAEPIVVSAAAWPTYPNEGFADAFGQLRERVEGNGHVAAATRKKV